MSINTAGFQSVSIQQMQSQYLSGSGRVTDSGNDGISFDQVLHGKSLENESLKFSKHATNRLYERNIELSSEQLERLSEGTSKAKGKGINESLVIVDKLAFIVNVPNKTVITAMDQTEADENVFTNIDGAVII